MLYTGSEYLDQFLKYKQELTLIYGVPATGKTTLATLAAIQVAKNGKRALFMDTENGFSIARLNQLVGDKCGELIRNIFLVKVTDFEEQCKRIDNLVAFADMFDLIVIDTIGAHYRNILKDDVYRVNKGMDMQLRALKEITRKNVPVIITNQVYCNIKNKNEICVVGGDMVKNWCDCVMQLQKKPRKIILRKPEKKEILFDIKNDGIFGVSKDESKKKKIK